MKWVLLDKQQSPLPQNFTCLSTSALADTNKKKDAEDVNNKRNWIWGIWEFSVIPSRFFCKSKNS